MKVKVWLTNVTNNATKPYRCINWDVFLIDWYAVNDTVHRMNEWIEGVKKSITKMDRISSYIDKSLWLKTWMELKKLV